MHFTEQEIRTRLADAYDRAYGISLGDFSREIRQGANREIPVSIMIDAFSTPGDGLPRSYHSRPISFACPKCANHLDLFISSSEYKP